MTLGKSILRFKKKKERKEETRAGPTSLVPGEEGDASETASGGQRFNEDWRKKKAIQM